MKEKEKNIYGIHQYTLTRRRKKSSLTEDLIAATLSGAVATVVTQPFDVLKTRKQVRTAATRKDRQ
jgi:hypothetical protein